MFSANVENFYMGVAIEWWLQSRHVIAKINVNVGPGGAPGDQLRGTLGGSLSFIDFYFGDDVQGSILIDPDNII